MTRLLFAASVVALALPATARTNMETSVINDLRKKGVPEDCLAKVTTNDAAKIRGWQNESEMSNGTKNRLIRDHTKRICAR